LDRPNLADRDDLLLPSHWYCFNEYILPELPLKNIETVASRKPSLGVIIPSRFQEKQIEFIANAIGSVRRQSKALEFDTYFYVAVDEGHAIDPKICTSLGFSCVESSGKSQVLALNAAIEHVKTDFVAFLEDDDEWCQNYLHFALIALQSAQFVSSNQLVVDVNGRILQINDFPTPSGWIMPISTLNKVGKLNPEYRFHLDNEWLGRLAQLSIDRVHLVECCAPLNLGNLSNRPLLGKFIKFSGKTSKISRHSSPLPLVRRLVHSGSGMQSIASNPEYKNISKIEYKNLADKFGYVPW
jgi:hypothetical protein